LTLASGQSPAITAADPPSSTGAVQPADIFAVARRGDVQAATALAKLNPAIAHLRSPDGRTPLHYAIEGAHLDMIFFLTQHGADLSAGPESPLFAAVTYPDPEIAAQLAQALLMNGSDPNAKRADGKSAIQVAAEKRNVGVVSLLAHRGAIGPQADAANVERVYFGRRYSFDVGGRPYVPEDIDGLPQDLINEFARLAHFDSARVKHLLKIAPGLAYGRATWDEMAIEAAAHMGIAELAHHLADRGAPVSTCTAAVMGLRARLESLVRSDAACVHERGAHDIALLAYTAFAEQRPQIADFLLRAGAAVDAPALGGMTTLHLAANKGYVELGEVLLAHGANVNAVTKSRGQEITPLTLAVRAKQARMIDFLKSKGARA
jgi:ankyrin repeat protein